MTEKLTSLASNASDKTATKKKVDPGMRALLTRIGILWLFIFFADSLIDFILNIFDVLSDSVMTFFDVFFQFEGYLAIEFVAEYFEITNRNAELLVFYGLLPFKLLILGYLFVKLYRLCKIMPKKFSHWKFKEKTLIHDSWLLMEWYSKLAVICCLFGPISLFFVF